MPIDRRLSVAPMMAFTDRHARYFLRQISRRTLLYTEMITSGAIVFGDQFKHLEYHQDEHPVAAQLGGNKPDELAKAARWVARLGYDEVNLNVGCPSDRVKSGCFGAALMGAPQTVANCVSAMRDACSLPVTVKCRIGIDDLDTYDHLVHFIDTVSRGGCDTFIIHARKAWLTGLSPKENREIPPLNYPRVYRLANDFSDLTFVLNGGIKSLDAVIEDAGPLDGAMVGRQAYAEPWMLSKADSRIFGVDDKALERHEVALSMRDYVRDHCARGERASHVLRHMLGLYQGMPGARHWRRTLSQQMNERNAGPDTIERAVDAVTTIIERQRNAA